MNCSLVSVAPRRFMSTDDTNANYRNRVDLYRIRMRPELWFILHSQDGNSAQAVESHKVQHFFQERCRHDRIFNLSSLDCYFITQERPEENQKQYSSPLRTD